MDIGTVGRNVTAKYGRCCRRKNSVTLIRQEQRQGVAVLAGDIPGGSPQRNGLALRTQCIQMFFFVEVKEEPGPETFPGQIFQLAAFFPAF